MGRAHEVRAKAMAATAAAKSSLYNRISREVYMAAKSGVPDPKTNITLRSAVEKAKRAQVPAHVIENAINKAKGGQGENLTSLRYEGYGPGNCCVIVEALTDNVNRAVSVRVYCYNSAVLSDVEDNVKRAVLQLFQARSGILMLNIYRSDIYDTILASDKNIAYIILDEPTEDCVVTQPESPSLGFEVISGSSTLAEQQYNYCVTLVDKLGNESTKNEWVHPLVTQANKQRVKLSWLPVTSAVQYKIYGRRGDSIGLMKTVNSDVHEFTDDGSVTPDQSQYEAYEDVEIKYNTLTSLNVDVSYADRQSRVDPTIGTR